MPMGNNWLKNMEKKTNAPYAVASMVLGIVSIVFGCFFVGLICGIIGLVLACKGQAVYNADPEKYDGGGMLKAGKVCSIIGIALSALFIIYSIVMMLALGSTIGTLGAMGSLFDM